MTHPVFYTGRHGVEQVYRPRRPKESPLWQCLCAHFYDFIQAYPEKYEKKYGFLKPVVVEASFHRADANRRQAGFGAIPVNKRNGESVFTGLGKRQQPKRVGVIDGR